MRPVIIVFAKAPVAGSVKTRLVPPFSPQGAALLHSAFVLDTIECLEALTPTVDIQLHVDRPTDTWPAIRVPVRLQHEGDLGLKMFKALAEALDSGRPGAIILGSDSPTLPPGHLDTLRRFHADVSLGPTEDGGYYAIGARRVDSRMFDGVRWSTRHALNDTLRSCTECGLSTSVGPYWFDVDRAADVERLRRCPTLARHTCNALKALDGSKKRAEEIKPA